MGMGGKKSTPAPKQEAPKPTVENKDYSTAQSVANANAQERASENAGASLLSTDATKDDELLKKKELGGTM